MANERAALDGVNKLFVVAPFVPDMAAWHEKVAAAAKAPAAWSSWSSRASRERARRRPTLRPAPSRSVTGRGKKPSGASSRRRRSARTSEGKSYVAKHFYGEAEGGWFAGVHDELFVQLLGRHTTSFTRFAMDNLAYFGGAGGD